MVAILAQNDSPNQVDSNDLSALRAKEIEREFRKNTLPSGFRLDAEGLWFQIPSKDEKTNLEEIWVCSPLEVVACVRDHDNQNWGRLLELRDLDGRLHEWVMPMSMMARDGAEYRDELLSRGLLIAPGSKARNLLTEYIQRSQPIIRARCTNQTGWNSNCFVLPDETISFAASEKILYQGPSSLRCGYGQAGTLEGWQIGSKLCQGNSRLIFTLSVSFASPLLSALQEENGGFHFRGPSSTGKTSALKVAASVWGGPDYLQRWRSTSNGLEGISIIRNDTLLCLDEIEQMDSSEIGEVAYMLANGSAKIRGEKQGGIRKISTWRFYFLSTGEISLADHIQQGGKRVRAGQEVRILDIPSDTGKYGIFEELHNFESPASFSDFLCQICRENYGVAARAFLKILVSKKEELISEIKNLSELIQKRISKKSLSGQATRVCKRFALVAAVGEVATMYGITGWRIGESEEAAQRCFNDWLTSRGGTGMQEETAAKAQVKKYFEQKGESAFTPWECDPVATKTINRAGTKKNSENEEGVEFFVFPQVFKTEICQGLDPNFVAKLLIKCGWILPSADGKSTRSERMFKNAKNTSRCFRFTPKVLSGED